MTVYSFGTLTAKNNIHPGHMRNQGIGSQYRAQSKYDAQIYGALRGEQGRRVAKGNRFYNDPLMRNRLYDYNSSSSSSSSSSKWGSALTSGITTGLSGAAAGFSVGGPWGALVGGVLGLIGGGIAGYNS